MRPRWSSARSVAVPLLLLLAACGRDSPTAIPEPEPPVEPPPARDLSWLQANAIPFRTAVPDGDFSDLAPLKEMIGDARVVSLGEATHGTREFFQMKHRIFEYLVRERGFNMFAIEAAWAEANRVNDYVQTGEGDPAELLAGMHFWTWNTQEVLDMILWMREHNQTAAPADRVSFHGFDMQYSALAMDEVVAYFTAVDPGALATVAQGFACWRTWEHAWSTYPNLGPQEVCASGVNLVYDLLVDRRETYEAASSAEAYARALRAARIVVQHEELSSRRWVGTTPLLRDRFMAENAEWILEQAGPDARIVLWAHNAHVMDVPFWMGGHLRQVYGPDMAIVAFSTYRGRANALRVVNRVITGPLGALPVPGAIAGSYSHAFEGIEAPRWFADLRPLRTSLPPSAAWLKGPLPFRMIGAAYDPEEDARYYFHVRLFDFFDIVIHFRETAESVLLTGND